MKPWQSGLLTFVIVFFLMILAAVAQAGELAGILMLPMIVAPLWVSIYQSRKKTERIRIEQEEYLRNKVRSSSARIISIDDSKSYRVTTIALDAENKAIYSYDGKEEIAIPLNSLIQCDIVENGCVVQSEQASGVILGAAIAGGVGALLGSAMSSSGGSYVTGLYIRFITDDLRSPLKTLHLITSRTEKTTGLSDRVKKDADEVYAFAIAGMRLKS